MREDEREATVTVKSCKVVCFCDESCNYDHADSRHLQIVREGEKDYDVSFSWRIFHPLAPFPPLVLQLWINFDFGRTEKGHTLSDDVYEEYNETCTMKAGEMSTQIKVRFACCQSR